MHNIVGRGTDKRVLNRSHGADIQFAHLQRFSSNSERLFEWVTNVSETQCIYILVAESEQQVELKDAIQAIKRKLGHSIITEAELSNAFLSDAILPYLRQKIGLLADVKLERRIKKGRYDARIGSLVIEFENPSSTLDKGIVQANDYIAEFRDKGQTITCLVFNGKNAVFVDERGPRGTIRDIEALITELEGQLSLLALLPVEAEDIVRILSPSFDVSRAHIKYLFQLFHSNKHVPFVQECYDLWDKVYGVATNLSTDAIEGIEQYAKDLEITAKGRKSVLEIVFVIETYLTIFMKLLVAAIAVKRSIVRFNSLSELLSPNALESFEKLSERVPFLRRAFEHDAFSWFTDPAKRDASEARQLEKMIESTYMILEKVDLSKIEIDLFRRAYQQFFEPSIRKALGEFYTNENIVNEVLDSCNYRGSHILDKTMADITCGSATFLIVAISRFIAEGKKQKLSDLAVLRKVTSQIVGIDIHPFAVTMARVNYLLALTRLITPETRAILDELELPIYWTDSLASFVQRSEPTGLPIVEVDVAPLGKFFLPDPTATPWDTLLKATKKAIDNGWQEQRYLQEFPQQVRLKYENTLKTLFTQFKKRAEEGRDGRWLSTLHNVVYIESLKGKCDFIVGNPPWVRIHNVDEQLRSRIGKRFAFYGHGSGWSIKFKKTKVPFNEQVDYAMAFIEAGLNFLRDGGQLGLVITSNLIRALYAGKMRQSLMLKTTIAKIVDYSLARIKLFEDAQNSPLIISLIKTAPKNDNSNLVVTMYNRLNEHMTWTSKQRELCLHPADLASPWVICPAEIVAILWKMQSAGPRLGDNPGVSMGVKTSANPLFIIRKFEPTDSPGIMIVQTENDETIKIEKEMIRPFVRGRDIEAWSFKIESHLLWTHDDVTGDVRKSLPQYATAYFTTERIIELLKKRDDWKVGEPVWTIFRVSKDKLKDKVAWQKIAKTIEACHIPSRMQRDSFGNVRVLVDSSIYFINAVREEQGISLLALLNSTAAKVYAVSYVNRTGAEYCQFFAWVIGLIPIPEELLEGSSKKLNQVSRELTSKLGKDKRLVSLLDDLVCKYYKISDRELKAMKEFLEFFERG